MKRFGLMIMLGFTAMQAHADPFGDIAILAALGQQLTELQRHWDTLNSAKNTAENQLNKLNDLGSFNSGSYGFGDFQNKLEDLKLRQGSSTWEEALNNIAGGNADRYASLVQAYERAHPTLNDDEYKRGASDTRLAMYQQNKRVNKAVSVQTTAAFNQVNKHLAAVHVLSKQIEGEKNKNTKSAVDLNTRLLVEMAYIQTDLFKLQALANQQAVQIQASEIADDSEAVRFNQLPNKK